MATKITPAQNDIYYEEIQFGASCSTATFAKFGAAVNYINAKHMHSFYMEYMGSLRPISGGEGGVICVPFSYEITGVAVYMRDYGTSGYTQIDITEISPAGTNNGSICTATLRLDNSETNGSTFYANYQNNTFRNPSSGSSRMFSFNDTTFTAGTTLRPDIDQNATGSLDLSLYIYYRAI